MGQVRRFPRLTGVLVALAVGAAAALVGVGRPDPGEPPRGEPPSDGARALVAAPPASLSTSERPPSCAAVVAGLPPRRQLAQLLMVGVDPGQVEPAVALAGSVGIGGIFVGGNDTTLLVGDQLARVHAAAALPLAVSVDEEGGRVQRVDALDGRVPSARVMAATMTAGQVRELARQRAVAMRARGITIDFAPVVDVTGQPDGAVIGDRSFGADPEAVVTYAGAFADGLRDGGVLPVVKHFPGHGRASGDSHQSTVVTPRLADLSTVDLVPYRRMLGGAPVAVMVGHMDVPDLTAGQPATLSPAAYQLLRDQLTFGGVAITDDLGGMKAVTSRYSLPDAVLTALAAGADIAFWASGAQLGEVLDVLEQAAASGRLPAERVREALGRVLRAKGAC
jgi:beta-N-acetylhexosaminidase